MSVIRTWSGNGLTAGAASTSSAGTGDTAFTAVSGGITITTDGIRSPQLTFPNPSGTAYQVRWNALGSLNNWSVRKYFSFSSLPSVSAGLITGLSSTGATIFRAEINPAGLIRLRNASTATWSQTSGELAVDTRYRIEVYGGSGSATVAVFAGESETPLINASGAVELLSLDEVRYGRHSTAITWTSEKADDLAIANTANLIGAVDPEVPPEPSVGIIRSWGGNGLVAGALTTATAGTGDTAFNTVTGDLQVTVNGLRSPRITLPDIATIKRVHWYPLDVAPLTAYALRWYMTLGDYSPAEIYLASGLLTGTGQWSVRMTAAGTIRLRDDAAAAVRWTGVQVIPLNTPIRFELIISAATATLKIYQGDYDVLLETGSGTVGSGADEARFGFTSSVASTGITYDDIAISNQAIMIGAVDPQQAPVGSPIIKKWTGNGLGPGSLSTSSAGTGDTAFNTVTGALTVVSNGQRVPRIALPDAAAIKRMHWYPLDVAPLTNYAVRWYMTLGAYSPAEIYLASGLLAGAGKWSIRMTSNGYLRLRDDEAAVIRWTSAVGVPLGVSLRFEFVVNGPTAVLAVYRGDYDVLVASCTGSIGAGADEARFGFTSSVASTGITYDDIAVSKQAIAIGPAAAPQPLRTHFRYTDLGWVAQEVTLL